MSNPLVLWCLTGRHLRQFSQKEGSGMKPYHSSKDVGRTAEKE